MDGCTYDNTPIWGICKGVGEQVLKYPRNKFSIRAQHQVMWNLVAHINMRFGRRCSQIPDNLLNKRPKIEPADLRVKYTLGTQRLDLFVEHFPNQLTQTLQIAGKTLKNLCIPGENGFIQHALEFLDQKRHGIQRCSKIMCKKGEVLLGLFLALHLRVGDKGRDREPCGLINTVIDDPGNLSDDHQSMTFGNGQKCNPQQVVFSHHFNHIEPVIKSLHAVKRRASQT